MPALSLDHWNTDCKDLEDGAFYERYVGLKDGDRPPFMFPGAWMYAGEKPILHIVSENGRKDHGTGAIDQSPSTARTSRAASPDEEGRVPYEVRKVPKRPLQQVFVHDPDGVMIELNFWNETDVPELKETGKAPVARDALAKKAKPKGKKQLVGAK